MSKVIWLLICFSLLISCIPVSSGAPVSTSIEEIAGDQSDRVARITAVFAQQQPLPSPLADAHLVEIKLGDGVLGPADYRTFAMLNVAPSDIASWQLILTPLTTPPTYAAPPVENDWWLNESDFATMTYYAPDAITNRSHGWIAIDATRGNIYIYTYTT